MLTLLSLLQARRDWPGPLLAERLDVSPRTVRRDVDRLRALGYPVTALKGPDGGYRLAPGQDLPPLLFDDRQAVALVVALRTTAAAGGDLGEAAERALAVVAQVLPSRLRHRVDALADTVVVSGEQPAVGTEVLLAVGAAVRSREVLRLRHRDETRRVEPHHLLHRRGRWYVLAWDLDRDDWRTFRLDRVEPLVPTGPRFARRPVPGGDPAALVEARFKGSAVRDAWPVVGRVVLDRPAGELAPFVGDGTLVDLGDGRSGLTLGSWSWPALAAAVARFDADVEDVSPAALRRAFGVLAERSRRAAAPPPRPRPGRTNGPTGSRSGRSGVGRQSR
ncbi:WYL domain-containing protein [Kineococcus endophyticus]